MPDRKPREGFELLCELVFRPEYQRRADDRRVGKSGAHRFLAFGLGAPVSRRGLQARADRRNVDQRPGGTFARGFSDVAGTIDMHAAHLRAEHAAEVHHGRRAINRAPDALCIRYIGRDETELPDLAERLNDIRLFRIALRDPDPDAALEQEFAHVAADESAAAEHRDQLFRTFDHGPGLCPSAPALTRRAAAL